MYARYVALSCCVSAKQLAKSASSARSLENEARGLTTPRSSKPPFYNSADAKAGFEDCIAPEIEVGQRLALPQHSCKTLCPSIADIIAAEIEVRQCCKLPQHSCKTLCPGCSYVIAAEIDVS
jgi:hypothetical protein